MFFVVPVTFSDMFILNINVFLAFIRLTYLGFCLINCVNTCYFTIFFIYISGVSSICSEKNCIAFLVNLLTKSVFVYFKNLRFCSF